MTTEVSRYEINRKVKLILIRHAVDLTKIEHSCAKETVYFYGSLHKDPKGDFEASTVEALIKELLSMHGVRSLQFDLSNWNINADYDSFSITKKR